MRKGNQLLQIRFNGYSIDRLASHVFLLFSVLYKQLNLPSQSTAFSSSYPQSLLIFRVPPNKIQSIFRMLFTKSFVALTATLLTSVCAQMTAPQIVSNINIITGQSQALQAPANSINLLSGPLFLIGQGPFPVGFSLLSPHRNSQLTQHSKLLSVSLKSSTQYPMISKRWP